MDVLFYGLSLVLFYFMDWVFCGKILVFHNYGLGALWHGNGVVLLFGLHWVFYRVFLPLLCCTGWVFYGINLVFCSINTVLCSVLWYMDWSFIISYNIGFSLSAIV